MDEVPLLTVVLVVALLFSKRFLRAGSAHCEGDGEALISLAVEEDRENEDRAGCLAINLFGTTSKRLGYSHQTSIVLPPIERHIGRLEHSNSLPCRLLPRHVFHRFQRSDARLTHR